MILLVSDPHFTDKPEDSYRFDLFNAISNWCEEYPINHIVLLGDLTNEKDNHSAKLVNKIVNGIFSLTAYCDVDILMGNHDYYDPENPYFEFLEIIPKAHFIDTPFCSLIDGALVVFVPHQKEFKMPQIQSTHKHPDYIFIHQCVDGAIAETGARLTGVDISPLSDLKPRGGIWGGDIHKPQRVGAVHYVGAPYNIRFGDNFEGRCILLDPDNFTHKELKFYTPRKISLTIRDASELDKVISFASGDFVKITLQLSKEEVPDWAKQKEQIIQFCKDAELKLTGPNLEVMKSSKRRKIKSKEQSSNEPRDVLKGFCKYERVPSEIKKAGLSIIKET